MIVSPYLSSAVYRFFRLIASQGVYGAQKLLGKPRDFETVIKLGDRFLGLLDRYSGDLFFPNTVDPDLAVEFLEMRFASPLTFSAFWNDEAMISIWLKLGIGGGCFKTVMPEPCMGNKRPRIQAVEIENIPALLNAMGLPGIGVERFMRVLQDAGRLFDYGRPLGLSVGGHCADDYIRVVTEAKSSSVDYFELNISCPNTDEGQDLMKNPSLIEPLLTRLRALTPKPIGVKVSPDLSDEQLLTIGEIVKGFDCSYINAGNTQFKSCLDAGLSADALTRGGGGLSGPSLFPRTLEMIRLLHPLKVPLIATGGIHSAETARAVLDSGASLVGMATALVQDPFVIVNLNNKLRNKI